MSAILGTAATLRFDGVAGFDCLHGTPRLIQPNNINQTLKIWLNGGHFPFAFSPPNLGFGGDRPGMVNRTLTDFVPNSP